MTLDEDTLERRVPRIGPAGRPPCAVNDDGLHAIRTPSPRKRSYSERCADLMRAEASR